MERPYYLARGKKGGERQANLGENIIFLPTGMPKEQGGSRCSGRGGGKFHVLTLLSGGKLHSSSGETEWEESTAW